MSSVKFLCSYCEFEADKSSIGDCDSVDSCPNCGAVLTEEQVFSHDATSHNFSGSFANSDGSQMYGHGFDDHQRARLPTNIITAGERKLTKMIASVCSKLHLSSEIIEQTNCFVLESVNQHPKFKMTNGKFRMVGACVYIICRANDIPLTIKQVAGACGCSHFLIGDYMKLIDVELNLNQTPVTVENLISVACSHLSKPKECEEIALLLYAESSSAMLLKGHRLPEAIGHAVMASLALNKGTTQKQAVDHLCNKMSQPLHTTVVNCICTLKRYMLKLVSEIPWVDMKYVKLSNIHHYLKDIARYRKTVGAFASESGSPSWFHVKEKEILIRKEKIRSAQERIKLKKTQSGEISDECLETSIEKNDDCSTLAKEAIADAPNSVETVELDEEDLTIEDLLEMGCSPEELQEGYYETLKSTLTTKSEIMDKEIESYVRTPDEVSKLKRFSDKEGTTFGLSEVELQNKQKRKRV